MKVNKAKRITDIDFERWRECPDCGEQNWAQNRGDAKRCCNCGKHLSIEDIELVEEIDDCWETVLAGGKADA